MLENLSEKIRGCYMNAEECEHQARQQNIPDLQRVYLDLAKRWTTLAHSYEFTERLQRFTFNPKR